MSRCLSDKTLTRVLAELGTAGERAHVATCPACTARCRRLTNELDAIRQVLVTTPEPPTRAVATGRRWVPAVAALSAVAVGAVMWVEVIVWKALQPDPDEARSQQVVAALADVSSALFSVDGEPARVLAESPVAGLERDGDTEGACDGPAELREAECGEAVLGHEEPVDLREVEAMGSSELDWDYPEQGG